MCVCVRERERERVTVCDGQQHRQQVAEAEKTKQGERVDGI